MRKTERLSLLGSTGSIGLQTLDVVRRLDGRIIPVALSANANVKLLEEQIREFRPEIACMFDERAARELKIKTADTGVKIVSGSGGLCEAAAYKSADITLNSVVGMVGLLPTLAALEADKRLALANKETLVAGGELVMKLAAEKKSVILPVDSEHSALFQCLKAGEQKEVRKLILTASGGPFFGMGREQLKNVQPRDALKNPNWEMGAKITVDSATMLNKGLEIIEAAWLFGFPAEKIDVVVHRESVIHSMVEYADGSVIAQLGVPDMRLPVQYALTYPERLSSPVQELELPRLAGLSFYEPDRENFWFMELAARALNEGGTAGAVLNGADEAAVGLFLEGKIGFSEIQQLVADALDTCAISVAADVDAVLLADRQAREFVRARSGA